MKSPERGDHLTVLRAPEPSREISADAHTIREALDWLESKYPKSHFSFEPFRQAFPRESSRISTDEMAVFRKRAEIAKNENKETKIFSLLAERIIQHCITDLGCLGDATVRHGSDFDELYNGADLVIEWKDKSIDPLVIDVTIADEESHVTQDKQRRQDEKINRRGSTTLSYYPENDGEYSMDVKAAHAVLFISKKTVKAFAERYVPLMKSKERLTAMISTYESHTSEDYQDLLKSTRNLLEKNSANLSEFLDSTRLRQALPDILFRQLAAQLTIAQKTLEREQVDKRTSIGREYPQLASVHKKLSDHITAQPAQNEQKAA